MTVKCQCLDAGKKKLDHCIIVTYDFVNGCAADDDEEPKVQLADHVSPR